MEILQISTFSDESGQDTKGKIFIVATIIVHSANNDKMLFLLKEIEKISGKIKKWSESGNKRKSEYANLIVKKKIVDFCTIYYSSFHNDKEYVKLIASHIAKSILTHANDKPYKAKISIDKVDKGTLKKLIKEIKLFHIRYDKIRGVAEEGSSLIRLADAVCGLIRDLENKNKPESYLKIFKKIKEV